MNRTKPIRILGVLAAALLPALGEDVPDPLPAGTVARYQHAEPVRSVAFSLDGKFLASGSGDMTLRLWEIAAGKEVSCFKGHTGEVTCVVFSPDGKLLASSSMDRTVRLWEIATGREVSCLNGHLEAALSVAFSPDGRFVASGGVDKQLHVWEAATAEALKWKSREARAVAFSPDGKRLALGCDGGVLLLREIATGREVFLKGHVGCIYSVSFSPDGRILASGGLDKTVRLWEVVTGKEVSSLQHERRIYSIAFSPDGRLLATGCGRNGSFGWDDVLCIWDTITGQEISRLGEGLGDEVLSVAFSPDGKLLASGGMDKTALIWNRPKLKPPLAALPIKPETLEGYWKDLASGDPTLAWEAQGALWNSGESGASLLGAKLHPVPPGSTVELDALIRDLDNDSLPVREAASQKLSALGESAQDALRKKLEKNPSPEVRDRISKLLAAQDLPLDHDPKALTEIRSLQVLEWMGTPQARTVLETLAKGAPGARLSRDAQAALARLDKR